MKERVSRVKAWLKGQWRYLPPAGWALVALAVVMAVAVTVSTVTANSRQDKPSAAEQVFQQRWRGVPASVDRAAAERATLDGTGYLWAEKCRVKLYAGGRIIDVDATWLSGGTGAAITGTRMWGCGGDYVPDRDRAEPVHDAPPLAVPRVAEDADRAAREGFPYVWQGLQGPRVYIVIEMPGGGVFPIDRALVDHPEAIPAAGQWVPNAPGVAAELK